MSSKYASLLKISVAGAVLLSVGACKPADKGQGALKSESVAALNLSKSEASVFAKYFQTKDCEVDEMEALGALAGLGLGESGSNNMTFQSRDFSGGLVTYKNMVVESEDEGADNFRAKTVVFHCPQMNQTAEDDAPGFARLDVNDAVFRTDETSLTFGTLNVSDPTSTAAASLVESMTKNRSLDQDEIGFGAVSATDITLQSKRMFGSLDTLSWGEIRGEDGQGKADMTVGNLDLTIPGRDGAQDMTIDFKGMSARNVHIGGKMDAEYAMSTEGFIGSVLGSSGPFQKPYDELIVETMKLDSEGFKVDFGGMEGLTSEQDGIITTRQSLKPSEITFKPSLADVPTFSRNYDMIKTLGLETVKFSGSSVTTLDSADDSMTVSDGLLIVEDALKLNFEYSAEGLKEMTAKAQEMAQSYQDPDLMEIYGPLKLRGFRLTLEDNSILERGMTLAKEMTGESESKIKLGLTMAVIGVAMAAENEVHAEVYSETMEAFANFVKKGGTLTIEANPPTPFAISPLLTDNADEIDASTLGLTASLEDAPE